VLVEGVKDGDRLFGGARYEPETNSENNNGKYER
jgi:hypothetical protein